jgi:hypothetical protein
MRNEPAFKHETEDLLSPTGKPGAAKRLLKIVIALFILASLIAGVAWLVGQVRYEKDQVSVSQGAPPVEAPARSLFDGSE